MKALAGHAEALAWSREFRKLLAASAGTHALLAIVLAVRFNPSIEFTPTPVMVDLIAPSQLPEAPAEPAKAAPPKPAPPPVEKVVMLPKERPPLPRPEPVKPKPPERKPQAKPVPTPPRPEPPAPTRTSEEILADLRSRVDSRDESAQQVIANLRAQRAGRFDPEGAAYHKKVLALLQSNWVGVRAFGNDPSLEARFSVRVDVGGGIVSVDLVQSSGNTFYDDSAERAIRKSAPLPPPPRGAMELDVRFRPGGVA